MSSIEWLMEGDPAIRWQAMRYLLDAPSEEWEGERSKVAEEGWGARVIAELKPDGQWPEARWTGTVWTLMSLLDMGMPADQPGVRRAALGHLDRHLPPGEPVEPQRLLKEMDLCHLGFWLRYGSYFFPDDPRVASLAETVLMWQMADGGWNCRLRRLPKTIHSSFHTTFNVLEGVREAGRQGVISRERAREAEKKALEFMLMHRMFKSDKTGKVVNRNFLDLTYPFTWRYRLMRGLDYLSGTPEIKDPRLTDAFDYLRERETKSGRWVVEKRIPGKVFFHMERAGGDSRWNTLIALKAFKALADPARPE
jgi:hypothetical protein